MSRAPLAVVIPALNEASHLPLLLADLQAGNSLIAELVVADGGSSDGTRQLAISAGARLVVAPRGRGPQLLAGLGATTAPWLWLLHADVRLPRHWPKRLRVALSHDPDLPLAWYADLRVPLPGLPYRVLETLVAWRSRLLQRPYGDQGLLLSRRVYEQTGGLQPLPLMEDLEFVERLAQDGSLRPLPLALTANPRQWQRHGLLATSWRNAMLRRAWRSGTDPHQLQQLYYRTPSQGTS